MNAYKYLIECGGDVNAQTYNSGKTPLHLAAGSDAVDCLKILLDAGADATGEGSFYGTPLHWASGNNASECVKLLISAGADVNAMKIYGTPLHWASGNNAPDTVNTLLAAGAFVNAKISGVKTTPLHWAAVMNADECVKLLIAAKADLYAENHRHETPLHWAARYDALQAAKRLVEAGANVNTENSYGNTPFHFAAQGYSLNVAKFFVETSRPKINHRNGDHETPLDVALIFSGQNKQKNRDASRKKKVERMIEYLESIGGQSYSPIKKNLPAANHLPRLAHLVFVKGLLEMGMI